MRKGSHFVGTEEELTKLMKESMKHFSEEELWLYNLEQSMEQSNSITEQEYINICEALAECVDRGYFNDAAYTVLMNKRIVFREKTVYVTIKAEGAPDDNTAYPNRLYPFGLTEAGKRFLNS